MKRPVCMAASIALHACLLVLLIMHVEQPTDARPVPPHALDREASELVSIVTKPVPALVVPKGDVGSPLTMKCPKGTELTLETGFIYDPEDDNRVIDAPKFMPAYRAGVRVGDRFLNPGARPDKDGYMLIGLERNGVQWVLRIKAALICYRP